MRRWLIYKPLAILMAVLLVPVFSWMEGGSPGGKPFQASAQTGCGTDNHIIPGACVNGSMVFVPDLSQLETDAVNAYLAEHSLPASDAHIIYDLGRSDLRNAIRANMISILLGIIQKPLLSRLPHEQRLYNILSNLVQQNEIALYQNALNQYHAWQNDPCHFTLDPVIASTYNLSYDGAGFCGSPLNSLFSGPPVPAESYFTAYGLRKSYGSPAETFPYFSALVNETTANVAEVVGIATAAGGILAAGAGTALGTSLLAATWAAEAGAAAIAAGSAGAGAPAAVGIATPGIYVLSGLTVQSSGPALLIAGPVSIVLIAIAIGVTAGLQAFDNQQTLNDLNNLSNSLNQATSTPPDLAAFAQDTSGLGLYKLETSSLSLTLPEVASSAPLPSHSSMDANFQIGSNSSAGNVSAALNYKDWNGNVWSAQNSGGWFVQTCSSANCAQKDSITGSLHYVDASGVKWTAARMGNRFLSTKAQPASTDAPCVADTITGVSSGSNFSNCTSYVSNNITLSDGDGNPVSVSITPKTPPVFAGPVTLPFTPGVPSAQTITASGNPAPTFSSSNSNLPANFSLNGGTPGSVQLMFDGSATAQEGNYSLTLTATNGTGTNATQIFTIDLSQHLQITSPNTLTGTAGLPVNFLVTTTGIPPIKLSVDPLLPLNGLSFTDNGNGTATISGVYQSSAIVNCLANSKQGPCGIIATNSQGTYEQQFTINLANAPSATVVPPTNANFTAGVSNQALISSTGAITPVTWKLGSSYSASGPNVPWLSLHDNLNGTATLFGTPPAGTSGTFTAGISSTALGAPETSTYYTVNVTDTPVFTNPNVAAFLANTFSSFAVSANEGTISLNSTLPKGLTFNTGNPASIEGAAATGTGGQYTVSLTDKASSGTSTTQSLNLNVYEAPAIASPNTATFMTGTPGSFAVTTTGFPSVSNGPVPANPLPPLNASQGSGMFFTVTGLPADLQFSNLNQQGFATGTLMIQGTPSAADAGVHQVQIAAQNGVGSVAQQILTLNIIKIAGPAPASATKCNGNYNGIFNGAITVSAGQNCSFIGGGTTGSIQVNGGTLALTNAKVGGNVAVQGAAAFLIGQGSTISGNLSIQNVASASGMHQVCGATVDGNLGVSRNATPIEIGSIDASCSGNSVGKNVSILSNTAPVSAYNNLVGKALSCSGNLSIAGNGDQAQTTSGQCVNF